ncbi:MAG TPA: bifunctional hydroxymethylpyrimidine kinase/phosphomethylpyrimidine kinase, partial [Phototrophicaceae bacterium]|nr:bifunctional hydroxymethylpyrimidine kinase/phosphomethylpyrimidine kinase [Phototrophicaceae bacterium]
ALTIAGSDSSGRAGIQADLKTFSALGIYGTTVITILTAQNTKTVSDVFVPTAEFFKSQHLTTQEDNKPDIIKIGVLYDDSIIEIVYDILRHLKIPIVLDPILISGTGVKLLKQSSIGNFKTKIIPLSFVITPNLIEAEMLTEDKISTEKEIIEAAYKIKKLGAGNVIIKGGHASNQNQKILDVLVEKENDEITKLYNDRLKIAETHGTGCNFSSALASFLAKGHGIKESFFLANDYVKEGLNCIAKVGDGIGVTNPLMNLYANSTRYKVLTSLYESVKILEELKDFYLLIPETKTNFVYSLENPKSMQDVAGIVGRITNFGNKIRSPNVVEFGASSHVSSAIISAHQLNHLFRSAINIKNDKKILDVCKANFVCSWYSRDEEKPENKDKEGFTVSWGVKNAMEKVPNAGVVFHHGDYGKEPMILIFGRDPHEIIDKIKIIISKLLGN